VGESNGGSPMGGRSQSSDVFAGGDRYSWSALRCGERKAVNLLPGRKEDRHLILGFKLDGRERFWDGPPIKKAAVYRIEVRIDRQGRVTERHCLLPCSLPIQASGQVTRRAPP
jgi:hypothetical protein